MDVTALHYLEAREKNCTKDFSEIDRWVRAIRPPRARRGVDAAAVARGAVLRGRLLAILIELE